MSDKWQMPPIYVGQKVLIFNSHTDWLKYTGRVDSPDVIRPCTGTVSDKGDRGIHVAELVDPRTGSQLQPRDGVRHITDPDRTRHDLERRGFWDYAQETRDFWDMKERLEVIEKQLKIEAPSVKAAKALEADRLARKKAREDAAKAADEASVKQRQELLARAQQRTLVS